MPDIFDEINPTVANKPKDIFDEINPQSAEQPIQPEAPSRGIMGDIASGVARGVLVNFPEMVGRAIKPFAPEFGENVVLGTKSLANDYDILKPSKEESESYTRRSIAGGLESLPSSMALPMTGAAIGTAIAPGIGTVIGGGIGTAVNLAGFYGSTYDRFMEDARKEGVSDEKAAPYAHLSAAIESGGELLSDIVGFLSFGLGKTVAKGATGVATKTLREVFRPTWKELGKGVVKVGTTEIGTEVLQNVGERWSEQQVGIPGESLTTAGLEAIGPAVVMTAVMGGGMHGLNTVNRRAMEKTLANPIPQELQGTPLQKAIETRINAVDIVAGELKNNKEYKDIAPEWWKYARNKVINNEPIDLDIPLDFTQKPADPFTAKIETSLEAADDASGSPLGIKEKRIADEQRANDEQVNALAEQERQRIINEQKAQAAQVALQPTEEAVTNIEPLIPGERVGTVQEPIRQEVAPEEIQKEVETQLTEEEKTILLIRKRNGLLKNIEPTITKNVDGNVVASFTTKSPLSGKLFERKFEIQKDGIYKELATETSPTNVAEKAPSTMPSVEQKVGEAAVTPEGKQPYEMTREEFSNPRTEYDLGLATKNEVNKVGANIKENEPMSHSERFDERYWQDIDKMVDGDYSDGSVHKATIKKALSEGNPVPENVLAQYPDLAKGEAGEVTIYKVTPEGKEIQAGDYVTTNKQKALKYIKDELPDGKITEKNVVADELSPSHIGIEDEFTYRSAKGEAKITPEPQAQGVQGTKLAEDKGVVGTKLQSISIQRVDQPEFIINKGDTVKAWFSKDDTREGKVVGISHANNQVRVEFPKSVRKGGQWFDLGQIYPAEQPKIEGKVTKGKPISTMLNKEPPGGWTEADKVPIPLTGTEKLKASHEKFKAKKAIKKNADIKAGDYVQFNQDGPEYYITGETKDRFELIDTKNRKQDIVKSTPLIKVDKQKAAEAQVKQEKKETLKAAIEEKKAAEKLAKEKVLVEKKAKVKKVAKPEPAKVFVPPEGIKKVSDHYLSPEGEKKANAGTLTNKQQKKYLIDEIDSAIKEAPEKEYPKSVTDVTGKTTITEPTETPDVVIEVPGDGEFTIKNNKDALREFKVRVNKTFPESEKVVETTGKLTLPSTRPTGKRFEGDEIVSYYNPFKARKQGIVEGEKVGTDRRNMYADGFFTNGRYAVKIDKSELGKITLSDNKPDIKTVISDAIADDKLQPAKIIGEYTDKDGNSRIHIVGGNGNAFVADPKLIDSVLTIHPTAKTFVLKEGYGAMAFKVKDEVVAIVQPMQHQTIPAQHAIRYEAISGNKAGEPFMASEQTAPELNKKAELFEKKPSEDTSDKEIARWKGILEGDPKGGNQRLANYLASQILGKPFGQNADEYIEGKGLTKFHEWAVEEVKRGQQAELNKKGEAVGKEENKVNRIAEIKVEMAKLQAQYEKKMEAGSRSGMVPPPIKQSALQGINKRMDKLDAELVELKKDESSFLKQADVQNLIYANNQSPDAVSNVQSEVDSFNKIIGLEGLDIKVVPNAKGFPERAQTAMKANDQAWAVTLDGTVYLNAEAYKGKQDIRQALYHEYIHLAGVLKTLGKEDYAKVTRVLDEYAAKPENKGVWEDIIRNNDFNMDNPNHVAKAYEELLAHVAENKPKGGVIFRIVQMIRKILRKLGINERFTDKDIIQNLIQRSMSQARMMSEWNQMQEGGQPSFLMSRSGEQIEVKDVPLAHEGIADEVESRGNNLTYRTVRNFDEADDILKALKEGNPSKGFRRATSEGYYEGDKEIAKTKIADKQGKVSVYTSPYPTVSGYYRQGADLFLAIEYSPEGLIHETNRVSKTQGKAYSAIFADSEQIIDANTIKNVWVLTPEQVNLVSQHMKNFENGFTKGYMNSFKDKDTAMSEANIKAARNLKPIVTDLGRPFIETPIKLGNGLMVKRGDRAILVTGDVVILKNWRPLSEQHKQFHPVGINGFLEVSGKIDKELYGIVARSNTPDVGVAYIVPSNERVTKDLINKVKENNKNKLAQLVSDRINELNKYKAEALSQKDNDRAGRISEQIKDIQDYADKNNIGAGEQPSFLKGNIESRYPLIKNNIVDGRNVRSHIPNMSSIDASIEHSTILPGIREVPMSEFDAPPVINAKTKALAEAIKTSGEINPLIVAIDKDGAYILEGANRYDAMKILEAKSIPAKVVIDEDSLSEPSFLKASPVQSDKTYLDAVNKGDMETAQKMVDEKLASIGAYWHGTPSGDLRGGTSGLHVGTKQAAMEALEARIGIPADGKGWDGTREYGETLLAGRDRVKSGQFGEYRDTGYNADSPHEDFYAKDHKFPTVSGGVLVDPKWKPWIRPVLIVGQMSKRHKTDSAANFSMGKRLKMGTATEGFYYKNIAEDDGSISAVLPNGESVRVKLPDPVTYDNNGKVIPLSQRFNEKEDDIRFLKQSATETAKDKQIVDNMMKSTKADPLYQQAIDKMKDSSFASMINDNKKIFNSRFGKLYDHHDMGIIERVLSIPAWLGKKYPFLGRHVRIETDAQEEKSKMIFDSFEGELGDMISEFNQTKNKGKLKELQDLIWKWDGIKMEGIAPWYIETKANETTSLKQIEINPQHYVEMRELLKNEGVSDRVVDVYVQIRKTLDEAFTVADSAMNKEGIEPSVIQEMREQIHRIADYFPHVREGDSFVSIIRNKTTDEEGNTEPEKTVYREHYDRKKEQYITSIEDKPRRRTERWLEKELAEGRLEGTREDYTIKEGKVTALPDEVFFQIPVEAMQQIIDVASREVKRNQDVDVSKALSKAVADTLKARGWGRHAIERENIPGFKQDDIFGTLFDYISGLAGFVTKIKRAKLHSQNLRALDAKAHPEEYKYNSKYVRDVLSNQDRIDRISDTIRGLFFVKYLGAVIKSGFINLTQNFVMAAPMLSVHTKNADFKISKAMADVRNGLISKAAWLNKEVKYANLSADEQLALHELIESGATTDSYLRELKGSIPGKGVGKQVRKVLDKAGIFMQIAEKFNRVSTGLAAYRVAKNEQGKTHDEAVAFAKGIIHDAHFQYGGFNLPSIMRGAENITGRIALRPMYTFRTFSHNYIHAMSHLLLNQGVSGKLAFLRSLRNLFLLGGVTSLPLAELIGKMLTGLIGDDDDDWKTKLRSMMPSQWLKDMVIYGLPGLAGMDFHGSMSMEAPKNWNEILGVPSSIYTDSKNMFNSWKSGQTFRALSDSPVTPLMIRNAMRAYELSTKGQVKRSGEEVNYFGSTGAKRITPVEAILKGVVGVQPTSVTNVGQAHEAQVQLREYVSDHKKEFADRYVNAMRDKDTKEIAKVLREVANWNKDARDKKKPYLLIDIRAAIKSRMSQGRDVPKAQRAVGREISKEWGAVK